jgi:hypothetical protein
MEIHLAGSSLANLAILSRFLKKNHSVFLGLSHADKQQGRRTDVSILTGAFLQQFLAIATQQLKPVITGNINFVASPSFRSASIMIPRVVLPNLLHDID